MQSRTPFSGQAGTAGPAGPSGPGGPAGLDGADAAVRGAGASAVGLSDELTSVIAAARRRAQRDGDRQIDTAHLLHTLLETVPCVAASLEGGPTQVARLLGYLAQRTIGYGLSWYGTVEDSGAVPRMREGGAHWSPTVEAAVARAGERARARGAVLAQGFDLFVAVTDDRECRAVEVLHRAGVDLDSLALRLAAESARLATEVARSQLDDGPVNG